MLRWLLYYDWIHVLYSGFSEFYLKRIEKRAQPEAWHSGGDHISPQHPTGVCVCPLKSRHSITGPIVGAILLKNTLMFPQILAICDR